MQSQEHGMDVTVELDGKRVTQARRLVERSDTVGWQLAGLAWEAIDRDGEPAGVWCEAVGLNRRTVERMRATYATFCGPDATRERLDGRSFWEHMELAQYPEETASRMVERAEREGRSVRTIARDTTGDSPSTREDQPRRKPGRPPSVATRFTALCQEITEILALVRAGEVTDNDRRKMGKTAQQAMLDLQMMSLFLRGELEDFEARLSEMASPA